MPNRIIRDAILGSERVAQLGWPEEVFYRRLMSIVDDYGRHEANPLLLRSKCYPLQTDNVRAADITRWMAACQKAGLILGYEVDGKGYLELCKFQQQQRSASKCPAPPAVDINCEQVIADAHLVVSVVEGVVEGVGVVDKHREARSKTPPAEQPGFTRFWDSYPAARRRVAKAQCLTLWRKEGLERHADAIVAHVVAMCRSTQWQEGYEPQPLRYLKEKRWLDGAPSASVTKLSTTGQRAAHNLQNWIDEGEANGTDGP